MICETMAGDNRFEIIAKAKHAILEGTNIETSEDEMKVLDNILFRCWQMGWLDKYGNQQPDGDLISRQDAIDALMNDSDWADAIPTIKSLPSAPSAEAEQVTGKLKNPCDSLLTDDSGVRKEQKSKLDLIRRQDAIDAIARDIPFITFTEDPKRTAQRIIGTVSSAETPTVSEKHQLSEETPTNTPTDLISRQDAIRWVKTECNPYGKPTLDFESGKKVIEHLGQMPSAPDSRQSGKWVRKYDGHINCYWYECDQCGEYRPRNQFGHEYNANFCPNCGADMRGEEE